MIKTNLKKLIFFLLLTSALCSVSSLDFSIGIELGNNLLIQNTSQEYSIFNDFYEIDRDLMNHFRGALFLDVLYLKGEVGYESLWGGESIQKQKNMDTGFEDIEKMPIQDQHTYLTLGLQGKYPFQLSWGTLYPLLGVKYMINLTAKDGDENDLRAAMTDDEIENLNRFSLQAGVGVDKSIADSWYLRGTFLAGYKFLSTVEKEEIDYMESTFIDQYNIQNWSISTTLGVGYTF